MGGGVWERDRRRRVQRTRQAGEEKFLLVIAGDMGERVELTEEKKKNSHPSP